MTSQPDLDYKISSAPQVYGWLRDMILRGVFQPGERLSEIEIARLIGLSRQPVREAFIRLASDGLAEIKPQRGTYISRISVSAVLSARFVREAVESDLARLVAIQPDDVLKELLLQLDREVEFQKAAVMQRDMDTFVRLDDRFHFLIAAAVQQEAVWSILEGLKSQMNRIRYIAARTFEAQKLIDQHVAVVEGLRAANQNEAEWAMRRHLREVLVDLPEITRSHSDYFTK